jgi:hypothetical protein
MMLDFCSVDPRLLGTAYVPLEDFELARAVAYAAIRLGARPCWCHRAARSSIRRMFSSPGHVTVHTRSASTVSAVPR